MTRKFIVDTNVWVRGSQTEAAGRDRCTVACFEFLQMIDRTGATVVLDLASIGDESDVPGNTVLQELNRNLTEQDYAHDLFWRKLYAEGRIDFVPLQYDEEGALYPEGMSIHQVEEDGTERPFEPNDRKWIALHLFHEEHPPICNASDGDWHKARRDLEQHGVVVRQICPWNWSS